METFNNKDFQFTSSVNISRFYNCRRHQPEIDFEYFQEERKTKVESHTEAVGKY